jgi:hypothetical protein
MSAFPELKRLFGRCVSEWFLIRVCVCVRMCICICMHVCMYACMYACMYVYPYVSMCCVCMSMCVCLCVSMLYVRVYALMYVCMYVYVYVCICACRLICVYEWMCVCIVLCMYVLCDCDLHNYWHSGDFWNSRLKRPPFVWCRETAPTETLYSAFHFGTWFLKKKPRRKPFQCFTTAFAESQ